MVPRTRSGAVWAAISPLFSLFRVLETLLSAFERQQLTAYVQMCVCSELAHRWLWRGPPGNHSHHFLVTAFSSNRKSTQRQEPPGLQTRVGPAQTPEAAAVTLLCREHSHGCAIGIQGSATRLCTCPLGNILPTVVFHSLLLLSFF